jgi:hypothetical protein
MRGFLYGGLSRGCEASDGALKTGHCDVVFYSVNSSAIKISPNLIIAIFANRKNQANPQKNK